MKPTLLISLFVSITFSLLTPLSSSANELDKLSYITEFYPPYNFKDQNQLKGIAVDLLLAATKSSSSKITSNSIRSFPWPRAYRMAEKGPKIVLFSTTRTEQREPLFHWVGPISPTRIVLLAKKSSSIKIESPADLNNYTIGAIIDDIGDQLVKSNGVKSSNIKYVPNADSIARMLSLGRIQLWAYEENVARWLIKKVGLKNDDFETVYTLNESDLYYALSKDIDIKTVNLLQQAIDNVKASDEFTAIQNKYL